MLDLVLLIGLPGSGKSTLAEHLAKQGKGWALVSTDAIRGQLFGNEATQGPWNLVQNAVERSLLAAAHQAYQGSIEGAIYDATNAARKQRRRAIALAHRCGFSRILGIWLDVPLEICLERNAKRQRRVPEEVIQRMQRQLEGAPPSLAEELNCLVCYAGFWQAAYPSSLTKRCLNLGEENFLHSPVLTEPQ